jgi:hypothetical protein
MARTAVRSRGAWPLVLVPLVLLALLLSSACGSRTTLEAAPDGVDLAGACGDAKCAGAETCASCSVDCGVCAGCGDASCGEAETCSTCPQDCGPCETCGDGFCKDGETCLSCAPDCGKCQACGDGTCDPKLETCFSCPDDCGACSGCGNGLCAASETCASCSGDCGLCAVCGNDKCEAPYETCTNCHKDCGDCDLLGCMPMLTCAFACIDGSTSPPTVHASCVGQCVARGCPSAQFLFDEAFNCFLQHLDDCPGGVDIGCLIKQCDAKVAACIGANCAK